MHTLALLLLLSAAPKQVVTVAAAANLKGALEQVVSRYEASHPDVEVKVTFGASGAFFAQLQGGAPFDVFLAADTEYPRKLVELGLAKEAKVYAVGSLVLWVPRESRLDLDAGVAVLLDAAVLKVAIGNPAVAPYGVAAEQALKAAGVYERVKPRLVLGQSVSQAAQFVESGNAQAGFLPLSLALAPPLSTSGRFVRVPTGGASKLEQAGVVLTAAKGPGRAFFEFLLGREGRDILSANGYGLPD